MVKPRVTAAGGPAAIKYVLAEALRTGRPAEVFERLRSPNTCKTCALGMGGQAGGMVNEAGHFPEFCKKSVQAITADMQPAIPESFFAGHDVDWLEHLSSTEAENLGRLAFPVMAGKGDRHFRRVSWDEALGVAGAAFATADPRRTFWYASGRSGNEAAYLLQLVARMYGSPNVHNCSFYCHNASSVALTRVYGTGTASVTLEDLQATDLALVAGANPASNHPRLVRELIEVRRRGGRVIVVNPVSELGLRRFRIPSDPRSLATGSTVSDLYLQPRVGGDVHLFVSVLKALLESGSVDHEFIAAATAGWPEVADFVASCTWPELTAGSGVERRHVEQCADLLLSARSGIFLWAMGLTHHAHGTDSILALANLALARGFLGRPGSGLLPIRGHSNIQGVGSMGVAPILKEAFAAELAQRYRVTELGAGQDTYASMQAADRGEIDACLLLGGNLWASNPDSQWSAQALRKIPVSVSLTTKLNPGHFVARGRTAVILPVLARDEEDQATSQESMFNYVRLSSGGEPAVPGQMRSEVSVLADLAERILPAGRYDWSPLRSHANLRQEIAATVPGYESLAVAAAEGEFHVAGRTHHGPVFPTPDGRAHFTVTPLPELPEGLTLMTLRSEGQFNSVVYETDDLYRGVSGRDVVMMNAADADELGLAEGQCVTVISATGRLPVRVQLIDIARGGVAMYYPEANVLVDRRLDPASKTPAFKSVPVRVVPGRVP